MSILQVLFLAIIQGLAELLPVSSSAHVIVAEKLMHLDPSSAEMTFLLVMLHTGTMFAVLVFFWKRWRAIWVGSPSARATFLKGLIFATVATGILGYALKGIIEHFFLGGYSKGEIEMLFSNLPLMAFSLAMAGVLILVSGFREKKMTGTAELERKNSILIGFVQGLCLPFRGFSRSGATISTGMLLNISKEKVEDFSFALAVILTPLVVLRELMRLVKAHAFSGEGVAASIGYGFLGMICSFFAGWLALIWVSRWIEAGKWKWFGFYCFAASVVVLVVNQYFL